MAWPNTITARLKGFGISNRSQLCNCQIRSTAHPKGTTACPESYGSMVAGFQFPDQAAQGIDFSTARGRSDGAISKMSQNAGNIISILGSGNQHANAKIA